MTERGSGLPSSQQLIELLDGEFGRLGFEIDDVMVDAAARPPRIRVIADGDRALDLDTIAELSRTSSALLDTLDTGAEPYVLEVTSPGVDRPLTAEKHFRRARGRKIAATLADASTVTGRVAAVADGTVDLVVRDGKRLSIRRVALPEISRAVVQVEFSPPSAEELAFVAAGSVDAGTDSGTESGA